jgi:hypothetical protein
MRVVLLLVGAAIAVAGVVIRLRRGSPVTGLGFGGPWGGGTAGVREPRRPLPAPPAGALALPEPVGPDDVAVLA